MVKHNFLLLDKLKINIFADSGDINKIIEYNSYKTIKLLPLMYRFLSIVRRTYTDLDKKPAFISRKKTVL